MHFDVIVVGARCAGASLAAFLARSGARVLVLDQARLPSDQPLSTHTVHPAGMDVLDELGVGAAIRSAPPVTRLCLRSGAGRVVALYPAGRVEYCPRRLRLDAALLDAALAAGAQILDQSRVLGVLSEGERVSGVRFRNGGREHVARADLVVGADGRHSLVARAVNAEEYLGYDAPRAMFWSYFPAPRCWTHDSEYAFDMYFGRIERSMRVVFQTDEQQLLLGSLPELGELDSWRANPAQKLSSDLACDPVIAPLIAGQVPSERVRAVTRVRYFFRRGAGPGWALLGDAGVHKEIVTGDGISEALLQARALSSAIQRGEQPALRRWWRERDVLALPLYCFGREQGRAGAAERLDELLFQRIAHDAELCERIALAFDHKISPYDALPFELVFGVLGRALLRGRFGVFGELRGRGQRRAEVLRELRARRRLLAECDGNNAELSSSLK